jgi:predicted transposase YbfD/YdcC
VDFPALPDEQAVESFFRALQTDLEDLRDPRGLRLNLAFVLTAVVAAQLCGARDVSSIHRFIFHRLPWLRKATGLSRARGPSRAHLPRLLIGVDIEGLAQIIAQHFGSAPKGWVALDGKTLRGASREGDRQAVVFAVDHENSLEIAHQTQIGEKLSEITVVRELLSSSGLESGHVTLDALHCNPGTLSQIAAAGGTYITQVKDNQPELTERCARLVQVEPPLAKHTSVDKGHGRLTEAMARLFALRPYTQDERWQESQLHYVVAITRETQQLKGKTCSRETAFYVTNASPQGSRQELLEELVRAVRGHWAVESNNWVRDVTLGEDTHRTKSGPLAQILALLRGLALAVLRRVGGNLRAAIDRFCYVPADLAHCLRAVKFL